VPELARNDVDGRKALHVLYLQVFSADRLTCIRHEYVYVLQQGLSADELKAAVHQTALKKQGRQSDDPSTDKQSCCTVSNAHPRHLCLSLRNLSGNTKKAECDACIYEWIGR